MLKEIKMDAEEKWWLTISTIDELGDIILKTNVPESGQTITLNYEIDYE